jgi:hypothetical protein
LRLSDVSFNMENAPQTSRGYFLGDYQGLAAAGSSLYTLLGEAGTGSSDPSNIWFRDPAPAAKNLDASPATAHGGPDLHGLPDWEMSAWEIPADLSRSGFAATSQPFSEGDPLPTMADTMETPAIPARPSADLLLPGGPHGAHRIAEDDAISEAIPSDSFSTVFPADPAE